MFVHRTQSPLPKPRHRNSGDRTYGMNRIESVNQTSTKRTPTAPAALAPWKLASFAAPPPAPAMPLDPPPYAAFRADGSRAANAQKEIRRPRSYTRSRDARDKKDKRQRQKKNRPTNRGATQTKPGTHRQRQTPTNGKAQRARRYDTLAYFQAAVRTTEQDGEEYSCKYATKGGSSTPGGVPESL